MKYVVRFFATVFALILIAKFVPGFTVTNIYTAIEVAVVLGLVNLFIRPLILLLTLPLTLITLGLFVFVVNALILWGIAAFAHLDGFAVDGFAPAFVAALILSAVHWITHRLT